MDTSEIPDGAERIGAYRLPRSPRAAVLAALGITESPDGALQDANGRAVLDVIVEDDTSRGILYRLPDEGGDEVGEYGKHWVGRGPDRDVDPTSESTIRRLWAQGATDDEIANELEDCSPALAKRLRLHLGLRHREAPAAQVADERIRRLHAAGKTSAEIAEEIGQKVSTVRNRLAGLGLKARKSRGGPRTAAVQFRVTEHERDVQLPEMAREAGFSSVSAYLRARAGLEP